jgi:hypothetical protein
MLPSGGVAPTAGSCKHEPRSAESDGRGWSTSGGRITALGIWREKRCGGRERDRQARVQRDGRGQRRRSSEVARDAGRAVRLVVNVVLALGLPLDVRTQTGRRTAFGERHHRRHEQLHQPQQHEHDNARP